MKNKIKNSKTTCIVLVLSFLFNLGFGQDGKKYINESVEDFDKRMSWFTDAKYGMFIHFGLYSQLGGVYKGENSGKYAEWIQSHLSIPAQEYAMLAHTFNPKDFNADIIAKTAKKAGMKYIVITSKHHEGFCLWDSEHTDFDVASTPFKGRDILAELSAACRKYGLRFGTYYSIIDWHHPSQQWNIDGDEGKQKQSLPQKVSQINGEYVTYMKNQVKELIDNYNTDILWFDGDWENWWTMETGVDLYEYIRGLKPGIIINNRVAKRKIFKKDFGTPEQEHPEGSLKHFWEACYTMNDSWGFKTNDTNWKSPEVVYKKLKDINGKGGNLLLNVGPDGNGVVPKESMKILLEVGKKLKKE